MIDWDICKQDFEWDGGFFHDIYVPNTIINDWQLFFDAIRNNSGYTLGFFVDNNLQYLPDNISNVFSTHQKYTLCLTLTKEDIQLNCHFFTSEEIEFTMDVRQINSQSDLNILLDLLQYIGTILGKSVLIKVGDEPNIYPIITYNPADKTFQYHH
jgi:hypothetical protein